LHKVKINDTQIVQGVRTFLDDIFRKAEKNSNLDKADKNDFTYRCGSLPMSGPEQKIVNLQFRNDTIEEDVTGENYQVTKSLHKCSEDQLNAVDNEKNMYISDKGTNVCAKPEENSIGGQRKENEIYIEDMNNDEQEGSNIYIYEDENKLQEEYIENNEQRISNCSEENYQDDISKETVEKPNTDSIEEKDQHYIHFTQESKKDIKQGDVIHTKQKQSFKQLNQDPLEDAYRILNLKNLAELDENEDLQIPVNSENNSKPTKKHKHYRSNSQGEVNNIII
jgi:hypothetical protein